MKSLIRVRGKRGNKSQKTRELENRTKHELEEVEEKLAFRLSYLERLPAELLQRVFIESQNVHLANTTKALRSQLLSLHAKKELIRLCFQNTELNNDDPAASRNFRALVTQDWFSFALLFEVIKDWMLSRALSKLESFLDDGLDRRRDLRKARNDIRDHLEATLRRLTRSQIKDSFGNLSFLEGHRMSDRRDWRSACCYRYCDARGTFLLCFAHQAWPFGVLGFLTTRVVRPLEGAEENEDQRVNYDTELELDDDRRCKDESEQFMLTIKHRYHIPPELCQAPFTQSKGDLLKFLLDRTTTNAFQSSPIELAAAATDALEDALMQLCFPAMFCISGAGNPSFINLEEYSDIHYFSTEIPKIPASVTKDITESVAGTSVEPWTRLSGSHLTRNKMLDARFEERHLACCVRNFSQQPRIYMGILENFSNQLKEMNVSTNFLNSLFVCAHSRKDEYRQPLIDLYRSLNITAGLS